MPKDLIIADDFDRAASYFKKQMKDVVASPYQLFAAPGFYKTDWGKRDGNNCYNFALHCPTGTYLQPGQLVEDGEYHASPETVSEIHEGALHDGLLYMGQTFLKCPRDHFPVALFFENEEDGDFHWLALRQKVRAGSPTGDMIWCHKDANQSPVVIPDDQTIFSIVRERYAVFGGYYAVPHDIALRDPVLPLKKFTL